MTIALSDFLARYTQRLLSESVRSVEDLNEEEVNFRPHENTNAVGFEAWHVARTADNLIHFAFARETPVWIAQGFVERWGLPKVDQGTGMDPNDAHGLKFPAGSELATYIKAVSEAIIPKIRAMSDAYLDETIPIKPFGEMKRADIIGQVIISHGNLHIGQMAAGRTMLGKPGMGF
ncbi:MAG: DinB family protein [Dehalococcoidia bacterium]|nr:DinB family protein [Dehalococcoidia bacterium]